MAKLDNRYSRVIEFLFQKESGIETQVVEIKRDDFNDACNKLNIAVPRNLGDIIYSFRYRNPLPDSVLAKAPAGKSWIIMPGGRNNADWQHERLRHQSLTIKPSHRSLRLDIRQARRITHPKSPHAVHSGDGSSRRCL